MFAKLAIQYGRITKTTNNCSSKVVVPPPPESNVGLQESSGLYRLNTKVAKFYGNKLALASKSIIYPVFRQRGFFLQL